MSEAVDSALYAKTVYDRAKFLVDAYGDYGDYGNPIRKAGFMLPDNPARLEINEVVDPEDWDGELAYQVVRNHDPRGRYALVLSTRTQLANHALYHISYDIDYYANREHADEYKRNMGMIALESQELLDQQKPADLSLPQNLVPNQSTMTRQQRKEWIAWLVAKGHNEGYAKLMLRASSFGL